MDPQPPQAKRSSLALAVFLIAVVTLFQYRTCESAKQAANSPQPPTPPASASTSAIPSTPTNEGLPAPVDVVTDYPRTRDVAPEEVVVDTDLYRARFTNRGAGLVELLLKKYFRTPQQAKDPLRANDPTAWLPLIEALDPDSPAFRLRRNPAGGTTVAPPMEQSNWTVARAPIPGGEELTFAFADGEGRRFEKVFRFRSGHYDFDFELRCASDRPGPTQGTESFLLLGASGIWDERTSNFQSAPAAVVTIADPDDLRIVEANALEDGAQSFRLEPREDLPPFFGVRSNFFAFALSPDVETARLVESVTCTRALDPYRLEQARATRSSEGESVDEPALREENLTNVLVEAALSVPFPARDAPARAIRLDVFGGPKSPDAMRDADDAAFRVLYELEYGGWTSLRWINRVLMWFMGLMERLSGNWGVAIVLLTLAVKVLLFPLNRLQSRTMEQFQKKMKLLQPQLEELKKKYKGNLQKLNVEQQKVMREHGVRPPVFGCLIVFLQMPVWIGLFQITRSAPELRHAPFFAWINDLSAPDIVPLPFKIPIIEHLHLLPVLMVVAWLVQNRMMPKPTDPQQAQMQKMMNFFPFIFLFLLYKYASGQSLYMLVNSLLGMLQMKLLRVTPTN